MVTRTLTAFVVLLALSNIAHAANAELVEKLKQLGSAVDNLSIFISTAETDADAEQMAVAIKQTFEQGLSADKPEIVIQARQGYCSVTIETLGWQLWSEAQGGTIINHGAKIH